METLARENNVNEVTAEKNKCFGCNACFNACPVGAISMKADDEGFYYPEINSSKCTDCGLCKKVCPSLNKSQTYEINTKNPECLAVMAEDDIRLKSSSGGAFTLLANVILEQGGYVCGVAFDENAQVKHILIDNKEELAKLRGSKYVQSDTNTVYSQIKDLLENDKKVLFTGTPCQVAGLNTFLKKSYDNLYTVDLLCHGVPSQKIWDMYLKETIGDEKFVTASFRDKLAGWTVYATTMTTTGLYSASSSQDTYLRAFLDNMCLRPSCGTCPFTSTRREAEITIGDFWAIDRYDKKLNDNKGTSVVLLNNEKGKKLFKQIKDNIPVQKKVPLEYASYYNVTLYRTLKQHPNRKAFFRLLSQGKSLKDTVEYCTRNKYDCALMTTFSYPNYGGIMTSFALDKIIQSLGYTTIIINNDGKIKNQFVTNFTKRHLKITKENLFNLPSRNILNSYSETVIVGSDCNWSPFFHYDSDLFLLSWVDESSKKVSYAPSFGMETFMNHKYRFDKNLVLKYKYFLDKFDRISVREHSGIKILENTFNINGTQVLDPVFLLNKEFYYENLIKPFNIFNDEKDYIGSYLFNLNDREMDIINQIAKKNCVSIKSYGLDVTSEIEEWLSLINNSKLFITNSFHGMCFAIIFNKDFICLGNKKIGNTRMLSLLKIFGLENRLVANIHSLENRPDLFEPIDWERVNSILAIEKERSLKWLKDALEAEKDLSKINPADAVIQKLQSDLIEAKSNSIPKDMIISTLRYHKTYRKYVKYKILKELVLGNTRKRYFEKYSKLKAEVKKVRNFVGGI